AASDEPGDDLVDLRMQQRFAPGNRDDRRSAFVDGPEALLGSEMLLEDVHRVLNLPATRTGEVAAEEGFEHQNDGKPAYPAELLPQHVGRHRPHLRKRNTHSEPPCP